MLMGTLYRKKKTKKKTNKNNKKHVYMPTILYTSVYSRKEIERYWTI